MAEAAPPTEVAVSAAAGKGMKLATPITMEHFDMGVTLGTGSFGRVRFATHKVKKI